MSTLASILAAAALAAAALLGVNETRDAAAAAEEAPKTCTLAHCGLVIF